MAQQNRHYLILGSTGSIGYAFAKEVLQQGEQVTLLVRDRKKAEKLFPVSANLQFAEGDAQHKELLQQLGAQATHIFHGINYPYPKWQGNMQRVTVNVIDAAAVNKATILFPGNIYNYGLTREITETSPEAPNTRKGAIRAELEQLLKQAAAGKCQVINVRLPDFWGPNVLNEGIAPVFRGALHGKAMPWLYRNDIPHQLVYTPDAALAFYELSKLPQPEPYALYNYAGEVVPSIKQWQAQIAAMAGTKPTHKLYSKAMFSVLGLLMPMMKEISEMAYLWQNTVLLRDDKLRQALPQLHRTPMPEAIQDTLQWFREYDAK
ncbi:NAD-dependent epimerase/dehydratase family protein [Pontibacter sp. SGAir0037]|uniref:NAD-dependent epimerase/dehydratase family protein n=1 Tax=Pontibacter sp. SGAir0037 TaxID=2571030 RepID=UPI0010CCF39C|nr:NAD-dependent epimerase/dehydratase family protein [Pontibacter sp. SGAir0037]QCR24455.1 NAD-dependent dehydratase [Pontibacter sp. SGAir0037]